MRPFKELANPVTGFKDRIPWDADRSRRQLQAIRQRHVDRLNAEDCERAKQAGVGHLIDKATGTVQTVELASNNPVAADDRESTLGSGQYVVNATASQIKHSGAMVLDAVIPEWREFCSKPQNDDNVEYPVADYIPRETRGRGVIMASPINATPVSVLTQERRKRGRPRRDAIGAV